MKKTLQIAFRGLALWLCIISAPVFAQVPELPRKKIEVPELHLSIDVPEDWYKAESSVKNVVVSYVAPGDLYPQMRIVVEESEEGNPERFFRAWLQKRREVRLHYEKQRALYQKPAFVADFSWRTIMGQLRSIRMIMPMGEKMMTISFVDEARKMDDLERERYMSCLGSIEIKSP